MERLLNVISAFRPDMPQTELGMLALEVLCDVGNYDAGTLWITLDQQQLTRVATYAETASSVDANVSVGAVQQYLQQIQRIGMVSWVAADAAVAAAMPAVLQLHHGHTSGHILFLPLAQTEFIGLVICFSPAAQPDPAMLHMMSEYTDHIAASLTAAMLYHQRQQTVRELRVALQRQQTLQQQLFSVSAPVLPVLPQVLLVPIIGDIDQQRAQYITDVLLTHVVEHHAIVVLLDVTGVLVIDTVVAAHLMRAAEAAHLLGCTTVLVGIRPEIAQVIVSLGIDLNQFITQPSLQEGIAYAAGLRNQRTGRGA